MGLGFGMALAFAACAIDPLGAALAFGGIGRPRAVVAVAPGLIGGVACLCRFSLLDGGNGGIRGGFLTFRHGGLPWVRLNVDVCRRLLMTG